MNPLLHGVLIGAAATLFAILVLSPAIGALIGCTCFDDPDLDDPEDHHPGHVEFGEWPCTFAQHKDAKEGAVPCICERTPYGPATKWGQHNGDNT